jgi:hypothetical protein
MLAVRFMTLILMTSGLMIRRVLLRVCVLRGTCYRLMLRLGGWVIVSLLRLE